MKILVANLGSTSFKYRLYDLPGEALLARGGVERIGAAISRTYVLQGGRAAETLAPVLNHAAAVSACLAQLADPEQGCLKSPDELAAIGFKAVLAQGVSGVQRVDDRVLAAMRACSAVAPAHNPPYLAAMRQLRAAFPELPLVAAFETSFHQTAPAGHRHYAVPHEWAERHGILRHGFHGASHRYIAGRMAELLGRNDLRLVSLHLGGSSSVCAIRGGASLGASMGMSPQSGLPNNNRVGDFDPFALPLLMERTGKTLPELLHVLAEESGLQGLSGGMNDLRDIEAAAGQGNDRAKLALDVFIASTRDWLGAMLVRLGGADALAFTGGIGENSATVRQAVCAGLESFGVRLDPAANAAAKGEARISATGAKTEIWTVPTNEELVVARQAYELLKAG